MEIITQEHTIRVQIITITGRLEAFTVAQLRNQQTDLLEAGHQNFVVDLQQLEFMDSAGMSALVTLLKRARHNGGDVVLVRPKEESAFRILTLTRFDQVFKIAETLQSAMQHF